MVDSIRLGGEDRSVELPKQEVKLSKRAKKSRRRQQRAIAKVEDQTDDNAEDGGGEEPEEIHSVKENDDRGSSKKAKGASGQPPCKSLSLDSYCSLTLFVCFSSKQSAEYLPNL